MASHNLPQNAAQPTACDMQHTTQCSINTTYTHTHRHIHTLAHTLHTNAKVSNYGNKLITNPTNRQVPRKLHMTCIAAQEEESPGYSGSSSSSSSTVSSCSCSSNFTILSVNLIYAQTHRPNNEREHCIISMETSERKDILHTCKSREREGRKRKEKYRERERDLESVPAENGAKAIGEDLNFSFEQHSTPGNIIQRFWHGTRHWFTILIDEWVDGVSVCVCRTEACVLFTTFKLTLMYATYSL